MSVVYIFGKHSSALICHHIKQLVRPLSLAQRCSTSIFEPDYLESGKSKIPLYNALNIQLKGYDFPVLESYQSFVHKIADNMNIEVEDGWAIPPQYLEVQRFKPQSTVVEAEYKMAIYERNVQVVDLPSTVGSIFFEVLQTALPEGVTMTVHEHEEAYEELRYIPDVQLLELKSELEKLRNPNVKRK
ncbi:39S ribosomal protein L48, mitochondrial isoform X2 [Zootermopsis nevadensis]|uniref:39S ribosomal protein L48, mitochondrial isoform X2 n=1 Tax=Zootermopsis nevadensis TaxID=136037 RepID=UPI000B8E6532|nr:39S ribosomal protein L48, mitochondrial isoform X2 [Zootermopsis nevadensis]